MIKSTRIEKKEEIKEEEEEEEEKEEVRNEVRIDRSRDGSGSRQSAATITLKQRCFCPFGLAFAIHGLKPV